MQDKASDSKSDDLLPLIKVVGTSGSGKSTLVAGLRNRGYNARPVSQEHSDVPDLWQQFDRPFVLIYLYADLAAQQARRPGSGSGEESFRQEQRRLSYARRAADLRVDTSALTSEGCPRTCRRLARSRPRAARGPSAWPHSTNRISHPICARGRLRLAVKSSPQAAVDTAALFWIWNTNSHRSIPPRAGRHTPP